MKKPDITKGEWTHNENDKTVISDDGDVMICEIDYIGVDKEEEKANAKAISAVPEMIDALIESQKELTILCDYLKFSDLKAMVRVEKIIKNNEQTLIKAGVEL